MSAAKPPVAIRITRPFQTEDEFLAAELDTISRTGVVLVGAQPRPEGVVLRFELALGSGAPLLRGEGRVIGYKAVAIGSEPGLSLRFTRLDSKSKTLVDRVSALQAERRERRSSMIPPPPSVPPPAPPPPPPPPAPSVDIPISVDTSADIPVAPSSSKDALPESSPISEHPPLAQAQDRNDLLTRLRKRASTIDPNDVTRILTDGAERRRR